MDNKNTYLIIAAAIVISGVIFLGGVQQSDPGSVEKNPLPTDIITYYYGETCPHCIEVAKFLDENKIAEKVEFSKKEVWKNAGNSAEMQQRISECGLDEDEVGVPFLYARGECLIGVPDVTEFFKNEAGMQ